MDIMDKDWNESVSIDLDISTMIRQADLSRRYSNIMITTNALAVFFYTIGGPMLRSVIYEDDETSTEPTIRELPLKMEFPFDINNSPVFELILIAQLLHDLSVACIIAMLNALIITLVSCDYIL